MNPDWETEGHDRRDLELPGAQVQLIRRNRCARIANTIVVINAGSPIRFGDWIDAVPAVLQAWYPGQEMGHALADLLSGRVNPSGKLPVTLPKRLGGQPDLFSTIPEQGRLRYGERCLRRPSLLRQTRHRARVSVRARSVVHDVPLRRETIDIRGTVTYCHRVARHHEHRRTARCRGGADVRRSAGASTSTGRFVSSRDLRRCSSTP